GWSCGPGLKQRNAIFQSSSLRLTETPGCGFKRCGRARSSSCRNRWFINCCSKRSVQHWICKQSWFIAITWAPRKEYFMADCATVLYPAGYQAERKFDRIIGNSAALESALDQVKQVAPADSTVLIEGETGTGKELIAHAIHIASQRFGRPLIKLNCAAIPLDLLESELFGHEKGAFTGAIAQKVGRFEMADKGTLFLDEVGDIPPALQPKLLRVLQEQEFERLGSGRTHKADVRLVAATNRDL